MNNDIFELENTKKYIKFLEDENKNLKEDFKRHIDRINELTTRIDKAIEYIEKNINKQLDEDYLMNRTNLAQSNKTLLDILRGNDE